MSQTPSEQYRVYNVWDAPTRWFHWINALAVLGNRYARWRAMLPYGPGYWGALRSYATAFLSGEPQQYVGHNPAARIAIVLLLLLLLLQTACLLYTSDAADE